MTNNIRKTFPSLRCTIGDWAYYISYMRFSDIKHWIKPTTEIHTSKGLNELIQRRLTDRSKDIAEYLVQQKERFFNTIVVGVYDGAPQWYSLEVGDSSLPGAPDLDEDSRYAMGFLAFEGHEKLFAIDGQHRVAGIKLALAQKPDLADEEQSVIFVAHKEDEEGRKRTRRLFTTLNKHAKKVSKTDIIALDEDEAFAVVTRRLVDQFPLLNSGFVNFEARSTSIPSSDQTSITTLMSLNDITESLSVPFETRDRAKKLKGLKQMRPPESVLEQIYEEQVQYWNLLKEYIPAYSELFYSKPEDRIAGKYRNSEGGHIMFRPVCQLAFARAVRIIRDRGQSMENAVKALSQVPMDLNAPPWQHVFWNPTQKTMNTKSSKWLTEGLFLHQVGHSPRKIQGKNLSAEYRRVVGDKAELPPVVHKLTLI
ncbi:MAG: hypothetical protein Fur0044_00920 [Anaerolineae bacterium]